MSSAYLPFNCGVLVIGDLSNITDFLADYEEDTPLFNIVVFSDTVNSGAGRRIYNALKKKNIGRVTKTKVCKNPSNTPNTNIEMFIWTPTADYKKQVLARINKRERSTASWMV